MVLTEDKHPVVLEHVARHLIACAFPEEARRFHLQWLPPEEKARARMRANRWKERGQGQIDFVQTLATDLAKDDVFVLVHVDGDRTWSKRRDRQQESNRSQFEREIIPRVRRLLDGLGKEAHLDRLLVIEPYYSIEAWLYQNAPELRRWYQQHFPKGHSDLVIVAAWEADPSLLDEVEKPKTKIAPHDTINVELASRGFPYQKVRGVEKSFSAAVQVVERCKPLRDALTV